jgi:dTMP kinase
MPATLRDILRAMPLITFEGVEGCGKSTQLGLLSERLRAAARPVVATREPGGTPIAEKMRAILLDAANADLDPMAELLLIEAARRQHVRQVLAPALSRGDFVLCDRFSDSTEAYQAAGRGLDAGFVSTLDARVRDGVAPDATLLYDLDPEVGLSRARRRDGDAGGRFEAEDLALHERVRNSYLAIARREPARVTVIPADGSADDVFRRTWEAVAKRFRLE